MDISFQAIGLTFEASITYYPEVPAQVWGPPEKCYPGEASDIEIHSLTVDGKDAMFLMDSDWWHEIESSAMETAAEPDEGTDRDDF